MALGVLCMAAACLGSTHVFTPEITLPKKNTAVVLGKGVKKDDYSSFLKTLDGFLSVKYVQGKEKLVLKTYEEYHYDNVFIVGNPATKLGGDLIDFVDSGRNIFVIADTAGATAEEQLSDDLRAVAVDCGVEFTTVAVRDNFGADPKVIRSKRFIDSSPVTGKTSDLKELVFSGLGLKPELDNPMVISIASATKTSYVNEKDILGRAYGANIALVAAMQTRIGSRATFSGSTEMFSNKNWAQNGAFAERVAKWAVQGKGVLRHGDIDAFKLVDGKEVKDGDMVRIKSHVRFSMPIEEFDVDRNGWVDFVPPQADPVQVEWTMLDPYVRADLKQVGKVHTAEVQAPDQYGIFKWVVDRRRPGYSPLVVHHQFPIRPYKLNEYDRFIAAAYPYYLSAFSAMAGFLLIGFSFLYVKEA